MQALGDRGRFNQVTSTQVAGDEMVKVSDQVLPSRTGHVWRAFPVVRHQTEDGKYPLLALEGSDVHSQQ